jgi:hypothetical protein
VRNRKQDWQRSARHVHEGGGKRRHG